MSTKKWIIISALAGVAVVAALSLSKAPTTPADQAPTGAHAPGLITAQVPVPPTPDSATAPPAPLIASAPQQPSQALLDSIAPPACRTSANGELVIDQQTREDVDMMTTLFKPADALAKLMQACKDEPAKAQQEMRNLHQQYTQYSQALVQAFPIEEQQAIPIEKLEGVLLKGMHELRVQYFGADKACAMFCEEEALTRQMLAIAVDYKQRNPKATTEEAVGMAQAEIMKDIEVKRAAKAKEAERK